MKLILSSLLAGGFLLLAPTAFAQAPTNDNLADRTIVGGLPFSEPGTTVGSTSEAGEPDHSPFAGNMASNSVWYSWTATLNGLVDIAESNSTFDTVLAVYTAGPANPIPADLVEVAESDRFFPGQGFEAVSIEVVKDETYYIVVDGWSSAAGVAQDSGPFTISITSPEPPPNDDFADAIALASEFPLAGTTGNNANASAEAGEPDHSFATFQNVATRSAWYSWVAPVTERIGFKVVGDFDSVIGVYTGDEINGAALSNLIEVGAQDVGAANVIEVAVVNVVQGTTYYIAVDGFLVADGGTYFLDLVALPPNDDFVNAVDLTGMALPLSVPGTTVEATTENFEPEHGNALRGNNSSNSVWYQWTAPGAGDTTVELLEVATFDPVLAVYTGTDLFDLVEVASTDAVGIENETLTFSATSGTTYFIAIDSGSNGIPVEGGAFTLNISGGLGGGDPFDAWVAGFPSLTGEDATRDANPAGDGIPNLMKLVLGLDPTIPLSIDPNRANFPRLTTVGNNPAIEYTVNEANLGKGGGKIQHGGEVSNDLKDWNNVGAINTGGNVWVVEIQSVGAEQRYGRIKASDPAAD